jgi:mRNA interferase RelE/StbE
MYEILFSSSAEKELFKLPKVVIQKIDTAILGLALEPRPSGCKKLKGFKDLYRIKVGSYRVIYSILDGVLVIEVLKIGHRKEVYN